jgi:hypothetical protein
MSKNRKEFYTQLVLNNLEGNIWTLEEAVKKWWFSSSPNTLFRLTQVGDLEFRHADLEYVDHTITPMKQASYYSFIADLNKKIKTPYYIDINQADKKPYIRIYDSRVSMMINLYGDLFTYLKHTKA